MKVSGARDVERASLCNALQHRGSSAACGISLASLKLWYSCEHLFNCRHFLVDSILKHLGHVRVGCFPGGVCLLPCVVILFQLRFVSLEEFVCLRGNIERLIWDTKRLLGFIHVFHPRLSVGCIATATASMPF